jgi:methionine-rich copper-binding protein CopC
MGRNLRLAAAVAAIFCAASAAEAAPRLTSTTPTAGSTVKSAPSSIRASFSEPIAPTMSGVAIANDKGEGVDTGKTQLNGNNIRQMVVPITSKLTPGTYTVVWHAVGGDGVRVTGTFQFDLKP